jgi:large subunit ribosomal protein L16
MKQQPSRLKYKKYHKPASSNLYLSEQKNIIPIKGQFALKALENKRITYNQLEACRKSIRRMIRKDGLVFLRIFTYHSITKKPLASRMGKGKGTHYIWMAPIKKGQIICEVLTFFIEKMDLSKKALKSGSTKLPLKTCIISNFY